MLTTYRVTYIAQGQAGVLNSKVTLNSDPAYHVTTFADIPAILAVAIFGSNQDTDKIDILTVQKIVKG